MPTHTQLDDLKFKKLLEEELRSSVMPLYKDKISETSNDDLTRDLYRVLVGNGGFQMGIMYKVAFTNVLLERLADKTNQVSETLDQQVRHCEAIQEAKQHQQDIDKVRAEATKEALGKTGQIAAIPDAKESGDLEVKEAMLLVRLVKEHKRFLIYAASILGSMILGMLGGTKATTTATEAERMATRNQIKQEVIGQVATDLRTILKEAKQNAAQDNTWPALGK